jgi:hypothetical protein
MSMQLLDETRQPIPICNVVDNDNGAQYYVSNPTQYTENRKQVQINRIYTVIAGTLLILFLCIFSLNFNASGWSTGNMLTFFIVVAIFYFTTQSGKQWNMHSAMLSEMTRQGTPCIKTEKDANIVYCKNDPPTFFKPLFK